MEGMTIELQYITWKDGQRKKKEKNIREKRNPGEESTEDCYLCSSKIYYNLVPPIVPRTVISYLIYI